MTNTILFDLQAAAMAMQANGQTAGTGDIPADGASFSDILAGVTTGTDSALAAANADGTAVDGELTEAAETLSAELSGVANEIMKAIENSGDGVKKALRQLLETVVDAIMGSRDKTERKTDIFLIISGGVNLADTADITGLALTDDDDMLVGMEILSQLGIVMGTEIKSGAESAADEILGELKEIVEKIFPKDDEDADENTVAEVLAALLNVQPEELETLFTEDVPEEVKTEAVTSAAEVLKAPMEIVAEQEPEKAIEAGKSFEMLTEVQNAEPEAARAAETVTVTFTAIKVNNASGQVNSISGGTQAPETTQTPAAPAAAETTGTAGTENDTVIVANVQTGPEQDTDTDADAEKNTGYAENIAAAEKIPEQDYAVYAPVREVTESKVTESGRDLSEWHVEGQVTERLEMEISGFGTESGTKELVMILEPEELGQVAVKIVKEGTEVSIVLSAQASDVGRLLTDRAQQLGGGLTSQNVDVKDIRVVEPGSAAEQMGLNFTDKGFSFNGGTQDYRGASGNSYVEFDGNDEETIADDIGEIRSREARLWTTA